MASNDPYVLQPITLLDAVNSMLSLIGSGARQSLERVDLNSDAEDALKTLHNWSIQLQSEGWQWNTDESLPIDPAPSDSPTIPGRIQLPINTLKVDTVDASESLDLVQRGFFLWDKANHTFNIGVTVYVDLVQALDFEELPQAARNYITIKAGRQFAAGKLSNANTNGFTTDAAVEAYVSLLHAEDESDDRTLYNKNGRLYRRHRHRRYS